MRDASHDTGSAPLMTAWNVESQIHLVVGANSLAAARCTKSLEAGARPIIIAPETTHMHFTLAESIANGSAQWIQREFEDGDLTAMGRADVDHVVDAVFVTLGGGHPLGRPDHMCVSLAQRLTDSYLQDLISQDCAGAYESQSMCLTLPICVPSPFFLHTQTAPFTLESQRLAEDASSHRG